MRGYRISDGQSAGNNRPCTPVDATGWGLSPAPFNRVALMTRRLSAIVTGSSYTRCPMRSPFACRKPGAIDTSWRAIACCWWARAGSWWASLPMPTPGERSTPGSPCPLEAGLEALGEVAGCGLVHRASDAERSAEQLLLGAQRAQPLVVGAGNVGAERHAGVGRQEVEAKRLGGGPTVDLPRRVRQRPRH